MAEAWTGMYMMTIPSEQRCTTKNICISTIFPGEFSIFVCVNRLNNKARTHISSLFRRYTDIFTVWLRRQAQWVAVMTHLRSDNESCGRWRSRYVAPWRHSSHVTWACCRSSHHGPRTSSLTNDFTHNTYTTTTSSSSIVIFIIVSPSNQWFWGVTVITAVFNARCNIYIRIRTAINNSAH